MVMFLLTDVVFEGSRVPQMRMVFPLSCPMKSLCVVCQRAARALQSRNAEPVKCAYHLVDEIVVVVREGRVVLVSSDGDLPCEPNQDINVSCGMPESRM